VRAVWLRGDLRTYDHAGLAQLAPADVVVFALDPALERRLPQARARWLYGALAEVDEWLGGQLTLVRLPHGPALAARLATAGVDEVITHAAVGPGMRRRLDAVATALHEHGATLRIVDSAYAVAPGSLDRDRWASFSAFYRAWLPRAIAADPAAAPRVPRLTVLGRDEDPARLATSVHAVRQPGRWARARLAAFVEASLARYAAERDLPSLDTTSHLSAALHVGAIHPRTILATVRDLPGAQRFVQELAWRDFYAHALWAHPRLPDLEIDETLRELHWDDGQAAEVRFEAWRAGATGYPLVDAGMRQLAQTGWLHNRVRMVVASFLVKDLHLDWRRGAAWFEHTLEDADLASNRGNWQWVAGTGLDAAPYFRIFNPTLQAKKFDPDGSYIRRWIPELRDAPTALIHEPWRWVGSGAAGYPAPIVEHETERRETLRRYEAARASRRQDAPRGG